MSSEINDLERLIALRDSGEIDEAEYNALKEQIFTRETPEKTNNEDRKQHVGVTVL